MKLNNIIKYPIEFNIENEYDLLIINDGDQLDKFKINSNMIIVGIVPDNRLDLYTPFPAKTLRFGVPDFGGKCNELNDYLSKELIPNLKERYKIKRLIYGGYSLGGLAAIYSLFNIDAFDIVFSICGSFWYPGFVDYVKNNKIITNAKVYLLNGELEGAKHNNLLEKAPIFAHEVHDCLKIKADAISIFDEYGHHENIEQRFNTIISLIK